MNFVKMNVSEENIQRMIEELSVYNSTPGCGITRVALSDEDMRGRVYIQNEMEALGMSISYDAAGNMIGVFHGTDSGTAPVWTGSHIDTVLNGGAFDGIAGVVCGIETIRMMRDAGIRPKRDICVVVYTSEEPTRYGVGCIGSRAMAGKLTEQDAKELFDKDDVSLYDTLKSRGFPIDAFDKVARQKGNVHAFVELHIEQAEVLEKHGKEIGIVHTISAPAEMHVTITGKQAHAGATPMELRKDPMAAAGIVITELEKYARSFENPSTVGTVGKMEVNPNAANVIPREVSFSVDVRSNSYEEKEAVLQRLERLFDALAEERDLVVKKKLICNDRPTNADEGILEKIDMACETHGYTHMRMSSGAYHDSLLVADFAPFAMIFVPSHDGISHDRAEWTDYSLLAKGTNVLADTLLELAME